MLRVIILFIIVGEGWAMIHFDYHNIGDELAGAGFALATLFAYQKGVERTRHEYSMGWILAGISIPMLVFLSMKNQLLNHVWMSFYGLIGFLFGWMVAPSDSCLIKLKPA